MEVKKILRHSAKKIRNSYTEKYLKSESEKLHKILVESDLWKKAKTIGLTYSLHNEIDTLPLLKKAWQEGKKVVAPIAFFKNREMKFKEVQSFADFKCTEHGLYEPIDVDGVFCNDIDLLVVPGLLFESCGYRIGFGGGFYDKYIETYNGQTIGLCFSWEKVERIPNETFDLPVNYLITQTGIERTS